MCWSRSQREARVGVRSRVWDHKTSSMAECGMFGQSLAVRCVTTTCLQTTTWTLTMFRFRFQQDHKHLNESLSYSSGRTKLLPSTNLPSLSDLKKLDAAPPQTRKSHLSFAMDVYIHVLYWAGELSLVYRILRDLHPSGRNPLLCYKGAAPQKPTATSNRGASLQSIPAHPRTV